jgi:hypothetical protein
MGHPAAFGFDARARECGAYPRCFEGEAYPGVTAFGLPPPADGSTIRIPPRVDAPGTITPYRPDHVQWWDHPTPREHGITPPVACAIAASERSSCARRPSSRIAARTRTTAIVSDTQGSKARWPAKSRAAPCSTTRRCQSTAQSTTRGLVRRAPRTASLALSRALTAVNSGRQCAR